MAERESTNDEDVGLVCSISHRTVPELAGVVEYDRAFHVEMPIKGNTGMLLSEQPFEGQLAILDRLAAQVAAFDLDQVKRTERGGMTIPVAAEPLENCKAIVVAQDGDISPT